MTEPILPPPPEQPYSPVSETPPEIIVPPPTFASRVLTVAKFVTLGMLGIVFVVLLRYRADALSAPRLAVEAVQRQIVAISDTLRGVPKPTPTATQLPVPGESECSTSQWVYVHEAGLTYHCVGRGQPKILTTELPSGRWYVSPQFINAETISYFECVRLGYMSDPSGPYTCSLVIRDLATDQTERVFSYDSFPNSANYHIGPDVSMYSWTKDGTKVVYVRSAYQEDPSLDVAESVNQVILLDIETDVSRILGSIPMPGGRGTGYEDEIKVMFSPDESKVLVQHFSLVESTVDGVQQLSEPVVLAVYSVVDGTPVWQSTPQFTTFGSFINETSILAKELTGGRASESSLISVNLTDGSKTQSGSANGWYKVTSIGPTKALYWTSEVEQIVPLVVEHDLETSSRLRSWPSLTLQDVISAEWARVALYEVCPDCEATMGGLPGVKMKSVGLLDLEMGSIQDLSAELPLSALYGDVRLP